MKLTMILILVLTGCAAEAQESTSDAEAAAGAPTTYGACVRSGEQFAPTEAACYRVKAQGSQPLANCYGDNSSSPTNEVLEEQGPGYIVIGFDVKPGECFYFYACNGLSFEENAPTVEPCP